MLPRIEQLIYLGFRGYVVALDRDTGEIVWSINNLESGYVALLVDGDRLIASINGYTYCIDPRTGEIMWRNALSGYGVGAPTLASLRGNSSHAHLAPPAPPARPRGGGPPQLVLLHQFLVVIRPHHTRGSATMPLSLSKCHLAAAVVAAGILTFVASPSGAKEVKRTHVYKTVKKLEIHADVYREEEKKRPVVLWIHGGALING